MRNRIALLLGMVLTATTLAWAGNTAGPGTSCPPDCQPCPTPCQALCTPCE